MRRISWMFLVVLGAAGLMQSQSSTDSMKLSGTVCRSTCVQNTGAGNVPTCNPLCTDQGGEAVLVDDQGNVRQIANQDLCKTHMGKHVKMTAVPVKPTEKQREESLRIMELYDDVGGG
jgi:hypothetical protein